MISEPDAKQNRLLSALPCAVWSSWKEQLKPVELPLGFALYEPGVIQTHAYFPVTAIVSLLCPLEDGHATEVSVVGNEGVVGVALFMGGESMPGRAVVQSAGHGYRLNSEFLKREFHREPAVTGLLLRYTHALITQMALMAVCNRHHSLDERLCHWLLLRLDRLPDSHIVMTQELIANMLGVRREGVTEAAVKLQSAEAIRYSRGRISVLDRRCLERRACECYAVVKNEYDRLLPDLITEERHRAQGFGFDLLPARRRLVPSVR